MNSMQSHQFESMNRKRCRQGCPRSVNSLLSIQKLADQAAGLAVVLLVELLPEIIACLGSPLGKKDLAFLTLAALFAASCAAGALTTSNYVNASRATHGLKITLDELGLDLGERASATLTFIVTNPSSLEVTLNRFSFSLYVNGRFVGVYDHLKKTRFSPGTNTLVRAPRSPDLTSPADKQWILPPHQARGDLRSRTGPSRESGSVLGRCGG